jgi:lycopene beta-cyclase
LAFGTAGRGGNPVTGYSVAHSLARADAVAMDITAAIDAGHRPGEVDPPRPADVLREAGLRALLRLDLDGTLELFEAFGRLPAARQRDFLSGDADAPGLAAAMWGMFARLPRSGRTELIRATLALDLGRSARLPR